MWKVKTKLVPVMISALGTMTTKLKKWLQQIPGKISVIDLRREEQPIGNSYDSYRAPGPLTSNTSGRELTLGWGRPLIPRLQAIRKRSFFEFYKIRERNYEYSMNSSWSSKSQEKIVHCKQMGICWLVGFISVMWYGRGGWFDPFWFGTFFVEGVKGRWVFARIAFHESYI